MHTPPCSHCPPPGCSRTVRFPGAARGGFIPRVEGKTESPPAARRELKPNHYTKKKGGSRREIRGECLRRLRLRPPCRRRTGNPAAAGSCPAVGGSTVSASDMKRSFASVFKSPAGPPPRTTP